MKTRNDFVSNSSSCSYIISVAKELGIANFAAWVAHMCSNPADEWHHDDFESMTERNVLFCLNAYELLFYGRMLAEEKEVKMSYNDLLNKHGKKYADMTWELAMKNAKENEYGRAFSDTTDEAKSYIDSDGVFHQFDRRYVEGFAVDRYDISYACDDDISIYPQFLDRIEECVKKKEDSSHEYNPFEMPIEMYQITKRTIAITEALRKRWPERIDVNDVFNRTIPCCPTYNKIRKELDAGNIVVSITANYSGGGMTSHSVYQEDGSPGISQEAEGVKILATEAQ